MKCNELVSHHVVSGCNRGWNLNHPAIVILNQLIIPPSPWNYGVIDKTNAINLEKFERRLVNTLAGIPAISQISNDRSMMRIRPGSPLEADFVSSSHDSMSLRIRCIQMADNVVSLVGVLMFYY